MNLPHDSRPQHVKPFGYPKTSTQPSLTCLPTKSVVPSYSTTPRVVFRPSTTTLSARPTPTIERSLSNRHLYLPYHPDDPPVRGCAKCHNRIYAGPGGLLGGRRGGGQTPAGPMSPGVLFRFSEFGKFSERPSNTSTFPPASQPSSPQQPTQDVRSFGCPKTTSQPSLTFLPTNPSFQPTQPRHPSFFDPQRPS